MNINLPFIVNPSTLLLQNTYPTSTLFKDTFIKASDNERKGIVRLWLTEGIPFAFQHNPILYEEIRNFVANGVIVNPKEVTLVGSGRIGYSLKPKVWGKGFMANSDLDFTIISNDLYNRLVDDFKKWVGDIESRKIKPNTENQLKSWMGSIQTIHNNIPKGFIYTKNLMPHNNYRTVVRCYKTMEILSERLSITANSPRVSDMSIRIYSNWENCIKQLDINLKSSLNLFPKKK